MFIGYVLADAENMFKLRKFNYASMSENACVNETIEQRNTCSYETQITKMHQGMYTLYTVYAHEQLQELLHLFTSSFLSKIFQMEI